MEEFKIININSKREDANEEVVEEVEEVVDYDYTPPRKRFFIIPIILIIAVVAFAVWQTISTYSEYEVVNRWERQDASEASFVSYKNNLIKYSSDGIFYTAYNGTLIWNYTYNMVKPRLETSDNYIIVYDKKGNEIDIFSQSGFVNSIKTNIPIVEAKVASKGTVAVMSQEEGVTYLQLYDLKGKSLAGGEIHPGKGGYPISIAISSDATRMMLSVVNLSEGSVRNDIIFYDFSSAGKEKEDNIIAKHSYIDKVIPQVEFLSGDKAVAFAEDQMIIYNNNDTATVMKEIYINDEIKSIFHNDKYVGYVTEKAGETGDIETQFTIYNLYGFKCMEKVINEEYDTVSLLNNDELLLLNGGNVSIYNMRGFNKFAYKFDENVYAIIPGVTSHRYYVVEQTNTEEISLKK